MQSPRVFTLLSQSLSTLSLHFTNLQMQGAPSPTPGPGSLQEESILPQPDT